MEAVTYFREEKQTIRVKGTYHSQTGIEQCKIEGYEIHLGDTIFTDEVGKSHCFRLIQIVRKAITARMDGLSVLIFIIYFIMMIGVIIGLNTDS